MPHDTTLIGTVVAGLGVAFLMGAVAHRLRISPIVGYLLAGVMVGPFTPGFVGYSFSFPGSAAYSASKAGLIGLTQALAAEFGAQNIRVNALLPGRVATDMFEAVNDSAEKQDFVTSLHALKRVAQPNEIARSVLSLSSDDASFVTGTASLVDGGASITRS